MAKKKRRPSPSTVSAAKDVVLGDKREVHHHGDVVQLAVNGEVILETARRHRVDLEAYLSNVLADVDHIEIRGILSVVREPPRAPIETLYTPLRSRESRRSSLVDRSCEPGEREDGPDAEEQEDPRVPLPELLRERARLLLVGQPGAGKTTFINLIACMLARDILAPRAPEVAPWRTEHLGLPPGDPPALPALIRFAELAHVLRQEDPKAPEPSDCGFILKILAAKTRPADAAADNGHDTRRTQWDEWLGRGDAILLLDGLDEVGDLAIRDRVVKIVRSACARWKGCRMVVTSRPIGVDVMTARPLDFHKAVIDDFGPEEIERFVEQWSAALYATAPSRGRESSRSLIEAIQGRPDLQELARNPVMLTCLCVIHYNERGEMPRGRARVYRVIVRWLLAAREAQRDERYEDGLAENALERLAMAMMKGVAGHPGKMATIDFGHAAEAIEDEIRLYYPDERDPRRLAERWLRDECSLSALIEEVEGNQLRFWHLTIQEFLASWSLARSSEWRRIVERLRDPLWDEVVGLFSGCVFECNGRDRVNELVAVILETGEGRGLVAEAQVIVDLGRVLEPMRAYRGYREGPDLRRRREAIASRVLEAILSVDGARQVRAELRIAAAEVIGAWGLDRRFDEGVDNFIEVPGTGVKLGRYPVTVMEYGRFVAAGRGEDGGRRRPWAWDEQQEHPTRPVVGVSWHQATAYCRWLGEVLGEVVRLPTAEEWERAATPATGEYPWGKVTPTTEDPTGLQPPDEVIAERLANFDEHVGAPTSVGLYPEGAGPFGHLDLAGNVWEWCLDGPPKEKEWRWLKGGSWFQERRALAAASRSGNWLDFDVIGLGFRVVVAREHLDP